MFTCAHQQTHVDFSHTTILGSSHTPPLPHHHSNAPPMTTTTLGNTGREGKPGGREIRQPMRVHSMPCPFFVFFVYITNSFYSISSTHAPTCRTRKMC